MPQAGQSMEEGTIRAWHVQPPAQVEKGQVLFEVETDKAVIDVEAVESGRLARIVVPEGGTVAVKQPVAYMAESDADVEAYLASQSGAPDVAATLATTPVTGPAGVQDAAPPAGGRVRASPAARKIAGERGVDLTALGVGSGPGGRIISTDVTAAASARPAGGGGEVRRKMSRMRQAIAASLVRSKQTIPHFYLQVSIDADALVARYQAEKVKNPCSINDLVVLACAKMVREFPVLRSRIENDEIVERPTVDIGIAVATEDGLLVPVLREADRQSLLEVAAAARRIVELARAGKVEGAGHSAMTVTNLGMFGVEAFSAIIQPPEPAILAVGAVREVPVVKDGRIQLGRTMTLTLSADHRLIDGVLAAKIMARLKEILESPQSLCGNSE
jgi:pyruvate dehydrogenase E2 component (dihydrolipoamide acetyltransferase)